MTARPLAGRAAIAFLADPASSFITGAVIPVDGGYTVRGDPGGDLGPRPPG